MADGQESADRAAESFQGLLLRYRGRSGLTQRELAARVGVSMRTVENWEAGVNYPSAQSLQALITGLPVAGGLRWRGRGCCGGDTHRAWYGGSAVGAATDNSGASPSAGRRRARGSTRPARYPGEAAAPHARGGQGVCV